jgi:hypothetical protein
MLFVVPEKVSLAPPRFLACVLELLIAVAPKPGRKSMQGTGTIDLNLAFSGP